MAVLEAASGGQVERALDGTRPREEGVVIAHADVHRRVAHQVAEGTEDVAVEQRLGGDEVGVVAGGDRELGLLRGEQAADGPLVVVARAVVGEHGEADRPIEPRGRGGERAARVRGVVDARDPGVAGVRTQVAHDAVRDVDRGPPGAVAVSVTVLPSRTRQRSAASLAVTRVRYGPRVNGVPEGPSR